MGGLQRRREKKQLEFINKPSNDISAVNTFVEAYGLAKQQINRLNQEIVRLNKIITEQKKLITDYKNKNDRIIILLKEITEQN